MSKTLEDVKLQDGTLIRHKMAGYEGRIEGILTALEAAATNVSVQVALAGVARTDGLQTILDKRVGGEIVSVA